MSELRGFVRTLIILFVIIGSIDPVSARPNPENGVIREYHDNGNLQYESKFKNGQLIRKRIWYRNGKLKFEERFKNEELVLRRSFYENGHVKNIWTKKSATTMHYNADGSFNFAVEQ